jgi:sterol desaturase/sphingolipid hydroxylase (fatty acid hydroxylase superfamily)
MPARDRHHGRALATVPNWHPRPAPLYSSPVSEGQFQVLRGTGFVAALTLALLLQRLRPHARLHGSWRVNGALWFTNFIIIGVVCGACACTVARWAANNGIGVLNIVPAPRWLGIAATIVTLDLVSYVWHRVNHRVSFLWRFHQVHHSDPTFTASTGVRFHPGELLLSLPVRLTAVTLIGASAEAVVGFEFVFSVANLVEHGDIDLPARFERLLGRVLITPALHRRHHTKCGPDRDTNFGTILAIWDRLFGTRTDNDSATAIETGLPGLEDVTLSRAFVLPLQGTVA